MGSNTTKSKRTTLRGRFYLAGVLGSIMPRVGE